MLRFPRKLWQDMTTADFATLERERVIAVLPVAAIEQHGPHLPISVDATIVGGIVARLVALVPDDLPVTFLPLMPVGKSNEHIAFPGTLTLSAETLIRLWTEIGESVARTGCRKLIFVNSHGGNVPIIDIVARELRIRRRMLAVHASWSRFGYPEGLFSARERSYGIHGGDAETSLMLAFRPDTVRTSELRDFVSVAESIDKEFKQLHVTQPNGFGWMSNDLNEHGAVGEADKATAAKGEAAAERGADAFIELLRDVAVFDLGRLGKGPLG